MNYENILFEKKNSIAYVTINRPKVLNALNMATMEELRAAFHDIKNDPGIRVAIMTGAGEKAFIAGADIGELAKHDAVSGKEYTHRGQSVLNLIENLGKPVIACINGFALGGGCEIAMACTMRLAFSPPRARSPRAWLFQRDRNRRATSLSNVSAATEASSNAAKTDAMEARCIRVSTPPDSFHQPAKSKPAPLAIPPPKLSTPAANA